MRREKQRSILFGLLPKSPKPTTLLSSAIMRVVRKLDTAGGVKCPCCGGFCKVYDRPLNNRLVSWLENLIEIYDARGQWVHVSRHEMLVTKGGDYAKLKYWRFIKSHPEKGGFWKPTKRGRKFIRGRLKVASHARVYKDTCFDYSGKKIGYLEAKEIKSRR
jgi:hypothetical protein